MKFTFFFGLTIFLLSSCSPSEFEGEIVYDTGGIEIFNEELSEEQIIKFFGNKTVTSFKPGGFYKDVSDAQKLAIQLWRSVDTSVYYFESQESDTVLQFITNNDKRLQIKHKLTEKAATILGYSCDMLEIFSERA